MWTALYGGPCADRAHERLGIEATAHVTVRSAEKAAGWLDGSMPKAEVEQLIATGQLQKLTGEAANGAPARFLRLVAFGAAATRRPCT